MRRDPDREKPTARPEIRDFCAEEDDFEIWIELFEKAVKIATNCRGARLEELYFEWLPLKLDKASHSTYMQATANTWEEMKTELSALLVDPQEECCWQSRKVTIKWDGKESLHALSTRVKRAVDKFERKMPQEYKNREYYNRFRDAFKKKLRQHIETMCPIGARTIELARDVAIRYQLARADDDDSTDDKEGYQAVGFTGSSGKLQPDRATGLENAMAALTVQLKSFGTTMGKVDERLGSVEARLERVENRTRSRERTPEDRGRDNRNQGRSRQFNRSPSPGRSTSREDGRSQRYDNRRNDNRDYRRDDRRNNDNSRDDRRNNDNSRDDRRNNDNNSRDDQRGRRQDDRRSNRQDNRNQGRSAESYAGLITTEDKQSESEQEDSQSRTRQQTSSRDQGSRQSGRGGN